MTPALRALEVLRRSRLVQRWVIPILIFLVAFPPRAIYPVSRTGEWFVRSFSFAEALLDLDPAGTYLRYHPGVSLMWLTAPALKIASGRIPGFSLDQVLGEAAARPGVLNSLIQAGVLPLALAISACIALTYPLLSRLAGRRLAIVASLLMALDPFLIAYSKVIHLDALLAMFMIVSVLFLLSYLHERQWHNLVLSGLFAGLAFLDKSPSFFLIPYAILVVSLTTFGPLLRADSSPGQGDLPGSLWQAARTLLVWGIVAALTFVALFPAMWVMPREILTAMSDSIFQHVNQPHKNPVFFAGRLWIGEDPGTPFYLAVIAWKTTIITSLSIIAALFFGIRRFRSPRGRIMWAMVAYALFFTLQMGMGAKKQVNYIMPVFPALSIVAAFGLVWTVEAIASWRRWRPGQWQPATLIGFIILVQAVLVLRRHPYYGTHHNLLLGGSGTAVKILPLQDQGEGLDLAAQYLNDLPFGETSVASIFHRSAGVFERSFNGISTVVQDPESDFRVYDLNSELRQYLQEDDWLQGRLSEQPEDLLHTVDFDGVTYVWIYGDAPDDPVGDGPRFETSYRLGETIRLEEVALSAEIVQPGDELTIVYVWKVDGPVDGHYKVFSHLTSADGQLVAQVDAIPLAAIRPTYTWAKGELFQDVYRIRLPEDMAPGEYELSAGMYDVYTSQRLPAYDRYGQRVQDDRMILATVTVGANE